MKLTSFFKILWEILISWNKQCCNPNLYTIHHLKGLA